MGDKWQRLLLVAIILGPSVLYGSDTKWNAIFGGILGLICAVGFVFYDPPSTKGDE